MSNEKPTDTDREIINFLKWVRENFRISHTYREKPRWQRYAGGSFQDDAHLLEIYKEEQNAKHQTHNKLN